MNAWQAVLLGLIQGLCEFLPVSSSGHLVLFQELLGVNDPGILLDTLLHVGTLIAIFVVFWRDIWEMIKHPLSKPVYLLVVATIPAVVATVLLGDFFEVAFTGKFLGLGFLATSVILFLSGKRQGSRRELGYADAVVMGCFQAFAILPGVSRSGSTISGGLFRGVNREQAAKFSFLMSIPAILGSVVLQVKDMVTGQAVALPVVPVLLGTAVAALSSLFAIKFMLYLVKRTDLRWFAFYTAALGILVCLDQWFFHLVFH
jgi:undecaprenyl-diphosphatase